MLVDCSSCINLATWKLFQGKKIEDLDFGHYDVINNPNEWALFVKNNKWEEQEQYSVAKLLTFRPIFNGVGSYLTSEILHRLYTIYRIPPWAKVTYVIVLFTK